MPGSGGMGGQTAPPAGPDARAQGRAARLAGYRVAGEGRLEGARGPKGRGGSPGRGRRRGRTDAGRAGGGGATACGGGGSRSSTRHRARRVWTGPRGAARLALFLPPAQPFLFRQGRHVAGGGAAARMRRLAQEAARRQAPIGLAPRIRQSAQPRAGPGGGGGCRGASPPPRRPHPAAAHQARRSRHPACKDAAGAAAAAPMSSRPCRLYGSSVAPAHGHALRGGPRCARRGGKRSGTAGRPRPLHDRNGRVRRLAAPLV